MPRVAVSKKRAKGKSGEALLDDILGSVDANATREKNASASKTERNKKPNGEKKTFDLASLASLRRGDKHRDGNRDENQMYSGMAIDLTADDAVGGGGGGSFIIHGADGGGRTKIVRPGGGQSSKNAVAVANGGGGASGSLDRFLVRE